MQVVVTLQLDVYDYNTITHLVFDGIISVDEAKEAECIKKLTPSEYRGWYLMVTRQQKKIV